MSSTPTPPDSVEEAYEQFRAADFEFYPAGDNLILVHTKNRRETRFLRADVVDLLMHCRKFRTLDEHLQTYRKGKRTNAMQDSALRWELKKLVQSGCLTSRSDALQTLRRPIEQDSAPGIASIGFPTSDRVETLQRGITSYIENGHRFGRTNDFVVLDDSASSETRDAYQRMLRALKAEHGVNILYAGLEEKVAFANKLVECGGLPRDIVYFACLGDKRYRTTTVGANRNALLLHTIGDLTFSTDDDIICRTADSPGKKEGRVAFSSGGDPVDLWSFPDRETALRSMSYVEQDILALHEQWLGKEPASYFAKYGQNCEVLFDEAEPHFLHRLQTQSNRVALTFNGTVGDCAWDNAYYHLFQRNETHERLTRSEQEYLSARGSREMAQVTSNITVTEQTNPVYTMCLGLDNRGLLPPFPPVGRAEDLAFGAMLSKWVDAPYAVHLPWVLLHAPPQKRSYLGREVFTVSLSSCLIYCIGLFDAGLGTTPAEKLRKLGRHVEEAGRLSEEAFEEFVHSHIRQSMSASIMQLEERMQNDGGASPAFWARDVKEFIALARRSASMPVDQLYEIEGGRESIQSLMVRFGQVLAWWPEIVGTAKRLRTEGCRLAQPV